jgi:hypothetical protein
MTMKDEQMIDDAPSYYSVIPANVRYDESLSKSAILLYGEISALTRKEGYCFASNAYFARLYRTTKRSVQTWLSELREAGHIMVQSGDDPRKIFLARPMKKTSRGHEENFTPPHEENFTHNTTVVNSKTNVADAPSIPLLLNTPKFRNAWDEWRSYKRHRRQTLTSDTMKRQLNKLCGMGEERAIAAINHSIEQGYTGLFEEHGRKTTRTERRENIKLPVSVY